MRTDKQKAIVLRMRGLSFSEIQKKLGRISKSTLSIWLSGVILPKTAQMRLSKRIKHGSMIGLLRASKNQTKRAWDNKRAIEKKESSRIKNITKENLFFLGIALYWAEGYKRPIVRNGRECTYHSVSLTNSDPILIRTFLDFLEKICGVSRNKVKVGLRIFEHMNEDEALRFWIQKTGIPRKNFGKTYRGISKSSMGKRPFNRLPHGVIQVNIANTNLFHRIMGWISGLKQQFD